MENETISLFYNLYINSMVDRTLCIWISLLLSSTNAQHISLFAQIDNRATTVNSYIQMWITEKNNKTATQIILFRLVSML